VKLYLHAKFERSLFEKIKVCSMPSIILGTLKLKNI